MNKIALVEELIKNRELYNFNKFSTKASGYFGIKNGRDRYTSKIVTGWVAYS